MFKDVKKFQEELDRYHDVKYASKVEIECAKAKGDLMSYKIVSKKSSNEYTRKINELNQTISEMKKELFTHQETISILSQEKAAQIKLYKTREDKEIDKVIALENKLKVLDNIVYKTGHSVQTMNMLNRNCKTSFSKPEFLKKAQSANPRLYDIGCYNDNLALMLAPESNEGIHLEKQSRSKLSDLIRPFDYEKFNNLYDLFVPQCEKSSTQRYFSERLSQISTVNLKTQFLNEIDRLSREYYYADHMNAILGVYTELDEVTNLQCDYLELLEKCECLEKELSKSKMMSKSFEALQKHAINLKIDLQQSSLTSQLETQKTQFLNEIDRLFREYYYADHMNAILGVYTELYEVTNLQCDYLELLQKCECLKTELSKSKMMSKSFQSVQKHTINLELELQQCKEKIKNDVSFKVNKSKDFCKEREQYFEIRDLKAQLQDKGIVIRMYKLNTDHTQARTSKLPQDSKKTNKRVSFSTGVIPTTSVSRP
uniref:Uncharacterized protein n=1 Tax=Tanacetum cinerariifolium TaxID=118510 RepID=A0A699K204_TANCI|nr:hypothetical protein [Tanacetum cinerariifolium]